MKYSIFWARLLGLFSVIIAAGYFIDSKDFQSLMTDMMQHHFIVVIMGMFSLLLGLAVVVTHQVWKGWPILVTLLGYWITIKGIILLFFPTVVNKMLLFWQTKNLAFAPLPALIIGLILLYCGFFLHRKE